MRSSWDVTVGAAMRVASELAEYSLPESSRTELETQELENILDPDASMLTQYDHRITDAALRTATRSRFVSEHYADAVEAGVKALNECVRQRSGRVEDGDALMTVAFSPNKPILRLGSGKSKSDESVQRGHMQLCQGVVSAWRNPRAHSILNDDPGKALMMLETINELMIVTLSATRTRNRTS